MTGHFEKGVWIEDPAPVREDIGEMHMHVKVHVDDCELRELRETLDGIRDVMSPPTTFWGRVRWLLFGGEVS